MKPTRKRSGSILGAVIAVVFTLALVVFAGLQLNQARNRLTGQIDALQSELSTAQSRIVELQEHVNAERAARAQAETAAKEAGTAAAQARRDQESQQAELGVRIKTLEASIQDYEQQVATAVEARTSAEKELSRETELRQTAEQEVADARDQLRKLEADASPTVPAASGASSARTQGAGDGSFDSRTRAASTVAGTESGSLPTSTSAAKQSFADETPADASATFDTPPKPVDLVSPDYPPSLKERGIMGNVVVAFTVDTRGRVQDIEVREASNHEFETAAVTAVRKWRFKPALRAGEPVAVRISQRLDFTRN